MTNQIPCGAKECPYHINDFHRNCLKRDITIDMCDKYRPDPTEKAYAIQDCLITPGPLCGGKK